MRKILFIAFVFWTSFVQSQTTQTVYQDVQHGDTLFMVKITNTGALDSVIRYSYSSHFIADSLVYDTIPYKYYFFNVTNTVKDSVQMNKLAIQPPLQSGVNIKTINSASPLGSGNITIAGAAEWGSVTGTLADQTDLLDALSAKQNTLGFTAVPDTRTVNGQPLTSDVSLSQSDIGLNNVDNTSDANKPVSAAQQTALNGKQNTISLTTTGTSGAATFVGNTLNIPNYATGGGSGYTTVILASDVTNNNATANTIADVTGLSFPVTSGVTYKFRFYIIYTSAVTTTGSRWSINGPATTLLQYTSRYTLTATTQTQNFASAYNIPAASNASSLTAGNCAIIEGVITPSASGTVIARFASEIASSAIVAKAKSYVEYQAQ